MHLMHSLLMFGRWKEAYPLAKEIYEKNGDHDPLGTGQDDPFCGFTLKLIAVLAGEDPAVTATEAQRFGLGAYQGMFDCWNDPQALEHAIAKACDDRMRRSQMEYSAIASPPIDLLPMEILAYMRVRERMGLETILPDHEALTNPMVCNLPRDLPVIEDDLIRRVVEAAQKDYPDIEYPNDEGSQDFAWEIDFKKRIPFVSKRRKPEELDRALLTGNEDQIDETVGDCDLTLIVDWKDTPRQVLESVVKLVPDFDWESDGQHDFTLKFCGRSLAVEHDPTKKYIADMVAGVAQVLEPEWEMRRYEPSKNDDTVVYVARPSEFWEIFENKAKRANQRLFGNV